MLIAVKAFLIQAINPELCLSKIKNLASVMKRKLKDPIRERKKQLIAFSLT
jgi:hypothetical protein